MLSDGFGRKCAFGRPNLLLGHASRMSGLCVLNGVVYIILIISSNNNKKRNHHQPAQVHCMTKASPLYLQQLLRCAA